MFSSLPASAAPPQKTPSETTHILRVFVGRANFSPDYA